VHSLVVVHESGVDVQSLSALQNIAASLPPLFLQSKAVVHCSVEVSTSTLQPHESERPSTPARATSVKKRVHLASLPGGGQGLGSVCTFMTYHVLGGLLFALAHWAQRAAGQKGKLWPSFKPLTPSLALSYS
jgi:hypothetical protein